MIGSEVQTPYGKRLDLLAIDSEGNLHILELKRDRTPREVVAQVLDYGSWVTTLSRENANNISNRHLDQPLKAVFAEVFDASPLDVLRGDVHHPKDDNAEWVVPVECLRTAPEGEAFWEKGMFASQHSACKLR